MPLMVFFHVYYHQKAKYYKHITIQQHAEKYKICERVHLLQKGIIGKRMLKVKAAQRGRSKNDVKDSTWIQSFFNFLSSQIKSDDILPEVKLDDVNNKKWGKPIKVSN